MNITKPQKTAICLIAALLISTLVVGIIMLKIGVIGISVLKIGDYPSKMTPITNINPEVTPKEPFVKQLKGFTIENSEDILITEKEFSVLEHFTAKSLAGYSQECSLNKSQEYFSNLLSKFTPEDKGITYHLIKMFSSQSLTWKITVIPNKLGYKNLNEFKQDFDKCHVAGTEYPKLVSDDYLLFISSCGSGIGPNDCYEVKEAVEPTIKMTNP